MSHTFHSNEHFPLEKGGSLPGFSLSYTTYGKLNADKSNVVWVCHALTGSADPFSWWPGIVGPDCVIDPKRHFIICANVLGGCYGSTGPLSVNPDTRTPWYHSFPELTNCDMVSAFRLLKTHLGFKQLLLLIGGSMGGQHALEWVAQEPNITKKLCLLATNAWHSPWGIAFNESQRMAIKADVSWQLNHARAGMDGLRVARSIAMLSYRSPAIYNERQQEHSSEIPTAFKAATYQQYQGVKLSERFNAFSYFRLSQAMDSHHIGRNRGDVKDVLARVKAESLVIGIRQDLLFPLPEQELLARHIPNARFIILNSDYGHDGFLTETGKIGPHIKKLLEEKTLVTI